MLELAQKIENFFGIHRKNVEPWQIFAARYLLDKSESGVKIEEFKEYIHLNYNVEDIQLQHFFRDEIEIPAGRNFSTARKPGPERRWIPPLDLVSMVVDYDELKDARRNARNAFWLSIIAIVISIVVGGIQLFKIQEVSITNDFIKSEITNLSDLNNKVRNLPEERRE